MNLKGLDPQAQVNINTASTTELVEKLEGVDPATAQRIVDYRELYGPFRIVEDLREVPEVGADVYGRNAGRLVVGPVLPASEAGAETRVLSGREYEEHGPQPISVSPATEEAAAAPAGDRGAPPVEERAAAPVPPSPEPRVRAKTAPPQDPARREPAPPPSERRPRERGRWVRSLLLVVLGGLLGALLTLALIVLWSGTLSFAPRSQVEALSRNLGTMQANSELAWQRLDRAEASVSQLSAQVAALQSLGQEVDTLQAELQAAQGDLDQVDSDLQALRGETTRRLSAMDERVGQTEAGLREFGTELGRVQGTVQSLDTRVRRFDLFLGSLRDLLDTLDQPTPPAASGSGAGEQTPTPAATSTATPRAAPTATR